ncbi:MAG TPA: hypothetical protein VFS18_04295 [Actinomycetota bacterium]|nr:hypothetical protein [Actinomycetota bacterium]
MFLRSSKLLTVAVVVAGLVGLLPGTAWAPRNLARSLATIEDVPCSTGAHGDGTFDGSVFMDDFVSREDMLFVTAYLTGICEAASGDVAVSDQGFRSLVTIDPLSSCEGLILHLSDPTVQGTVPDEDLARPDEVDSVTVMLSQTEVTLEGDPGAARALVCRIARHHERWDSVREADELNKLVNAPARRGGS